MYETLSENRTDNGLQIWFANHYFTSGSPKFLLNVFIFLGTITLCNELV